MKDAPLEYYRASELAAYAYADPRPPAMLFVAQSGLIWGIFLFLGSGVAMRSDPGWIGDRRLILLAAAHGTIGLLLVMTAVGLLRLKKWSRCGMILACIAGIAWWGFTHYLLNRIGLAGGLRISDQSANVQYPAIFMATCLGCVQGLIGLLVLCRMPAKEAVEEVPAARDMSAEVLAQHKHRAVVTIVRALAVVGLVLAIAEVCRVGVVVVARQVLGRQSDFAFDWHPAFNWATAFSLTIRHVATVALLASSVGCLCFAPAARLGMLMYCWLTLASSALGWLLSAQFNLDAGGRGWASRVPGMTSLAYVLKYAQPLVNDLAFPALVWFTLTRQGIRDLFRRRY